MPQRARCSDCPLTWTARAHTGGPTGALPPFAANDAKALNYMLAIGQVQFALFSYGMQNLTANDFENAGFNKSVYTELQLMQQEHTVRPRALPCVRQRGGPPSLTAAAHAPRVGAARHLGQVQMAWMMAEIVVLNATVVSSCTYNFSSLYELTNSTDMSTGSSSTNNETSGDMTGSQNSTMMITPVSFMQAALRIHNLTLEAYIGVINRIRFVLPPPPGQLDAVGNSCCTHGAMGPLHPPGPQQRWHRPDVRIDHRYRGPPCRLPELDAQPPAVPGCV